MAWQPYQYQQPVQPRGLLDVAPSVPSSPSIADYLQNYNAMNEAFRVGPMDYQRFMWEPEVAAQASVPSSPIDVMMGVGDERQDRDREVMEAPDVSGWGQADVGDMPRGAYGNESFAGRVHSPSAQGFSLSGILDALTPDMPSGPLGWLDVAAQAAVPGYGMVRGVSGLLDAFSGPDVGATPGEMPSGSYGFTRQTANMPGAKALQGKARREAAKDREDARGQVRDAVERSLRDKDFSGKWGR